MLPEIRAELERASFLTLQNGRLCVRLTNWGARLLEVVDGGVNLLCGPWDVASLAEDTCYCGAICGRVANRIANGDFSLEGRSYTLATNNGANHLHGGDRGFDSRLWEIQEQTQERVKLALLSPSGEEGYPGAVQVQAIYELKGARLSLAMEAQTDAPTLLNLTNHAYWNLMGQGTINAHILRVNADRYTPMVVNIPTGEICSVAGTRFDLREGQLLTGEYDDNYVLASPGALHEAAQLSCGGRVLTVNTDAPGLQVYTGDYLPRPRAGVALEAQSFPDSPHHANFPSIELRPGVVWRRTIVWCVG